VRRRQVSPSNLLEAAIARVEARNPKINAVTSRTTWFDRKPALAS
jgi:Asp-tRNA(Asn)/Glu-tRNA(Gln) amidotransferase A subunit family amidase